jgi:hypothetical protein
MSEQLASLSPEAPRVDFLSPWMPQDGSEPEGANQHELFRRMVFGLMRAQCPWLLRIVENAGGQILAGKGAFYVAIPWGSPDWIEVPQLSAWLHLVPWREEQEEAH